MAFQRQWHESYPPGVRAEFEIERVTMPDALKRTVERFPGRSAFNYMGKTITFAGLEKLVNRFTRALSALGVDKNTVVGMLLPNIPQVIIADYAVYNHGAVAAMNNPLYTERELEYQLNDCGCSVVVTLDLLLPRLLKLKEKTGVKTIITCHINDFLPFPKKQLFPLVKKDMYRKIEPQEDVYQFMDLLGAYSDAPVENLSEWDKTAVLIYTGGTTGVSKGAMLSHGNISSVVQQFTEWFPDLHMGEESLLGIYPIFHSAGYSVSQNLTIWNGWNCILIPRPGPEIIVESLKKYRPGFLPGVPTIYTALLENSEFRNMDLSFVKGYFAGAAPLPGDTIQELKKLHRADIYDVYGATENTAFATATPWKGRIKPGTVGVPLPNTDIRIVDPDTGTRELGPGEAGEICVRGPQVMKGYYNRPEETRDALKEGWFFLGDIGVMDEDGYLSIVDRKKDIIIAGGFNVYPMEVDQVLFDHPGILEACTIGVSDPYRGETVKAFVVPVPGEKLSEDDVIEFCRGRLAGYKVPHMVEFLDELPKSSIGKILRRKLREMEEERAGQGRSE